MTALHGAGSQTAGMLRISKGKDERHVWSVHLAGWLAIGWRVTVSGLPAATVDPGMEARSAEASAALVPAPEEHEAQNDAKTASTRGRRGRRPREEPVQEAAADVAAAEPLPAEATELAFTALPDDLFDDPLT